MSLRVEDFPAFFEAISVEPRQPFQWQRRLAEHLARTGRWPHQIDAPTGSGKKSVIDVHLFACALEAEGHGARVPRRLAMVVNRRVLVDDQFDHARYLADRLRRPSAPILVAVAEALSRLRATKGDPLVVTRLRGGVVPDRSWTDEPTACQVLCCTPDMWGSRLLFRGYGASPSARPREAGLLAFDAAVVVDEAHLSRQLVTTARRVSELCCVAERPIAASSGGRSSSSSTPGLPPGRGRSTEQTTRDPDVKAALLAQLVEADPELADRPRPDDADKGIPALQVVETTATPGGARGKDEIGVEEADLEIDESLARRLRRPKPLSLLPMTDWPIPAKKGKARTDALAALADKAEELLREHGPTVGCVVNHVRTALDLGRLLEKRGHPVETCCGRMRDFDLDELRRRRPGLLTIDSDPEVAFIVATQCLEVGADLDWTALLTELAPGSAIAQRAGRVNRRGNRESGPIAVAVPAAPIDPKGQEGKKGPGDAYLPYTRSDLLATQELLEKLAEGSSGLAPWALRVEPPPPQAPRRVLFQRPELAQSWQWSRTSESLAHEPELDLWLSDDMRLEIDVGVVVRRDLPAATEEAIALLRCLPPRDYEVFPAAIGTARRAIEVTLERIEHAGDAPPYPGPFVVRRDEVHPYHPSSGIRPGDVLVLDARTPVFTVAGHAGVLDPDGEDTVEDVLGAAGDLLLRLDATAFRNPNESGTWLAEAEPLLAVPRVTAGTRRALADLLERCLGEVRLVEPDAVGRIVTLLRTRVKDSEVLPLRDADGELARVVVVDLRRHPVDEEIRQRWTPSREEVSLPVHLAAVEERTKTVVERVGLADRLRPLVILAARHHDDGKADRRFQRALEAEEGVLLAKSGMASRTEVREAWIRSGLPRGWSHEQLSVLLCWPRLKELAEADRDLVARLVGTSHGDARALPQHTWAELGADVDGADPDLAIVLFDEGEWEALIERTHDDLGVWGCAYLEALLRAADCQISSEGS